MASMSLRCSASGKIKASILARSQQPNQFVALAARYGIPAIHDYHMSVAVGGLMSYGTDFDDAYRIVGTYAGKILSGTNTADLPVQGVPGANQPQSPPRARPHHPARHPCPRQRGDRVVSYATPTATRRKAMPAILTTSEEFEQWLTTPVEDAPKLQRAP
jgi:hypothetical protein